MAVPFRNTIVDPTRRRSDALAAPSLKGYKLRVTTGSFTVHPCQHGYLLRPQVFRSVREALSHAYERHADERWVIR